MTVSALAAYRQRVCRAGRRCAAALLGVVLVAGCGGDDSPPLTATVGATSAGQVTPASTAEPAVAAIVFAEGVVSGTNAPWRPVERYAADAPAIYAVVRVANLPADAMLTARWTLNGTPIEGVTRAIVLGQSYLGGYAEFHLIKPDDRAWPDGVYAVTISLDGRVMRSAEVEVAGG